MLKLGHIVYSNCFPPHAGIVTKQTAFPFTLVEGVPTELNRLLYEGGVDVSPSSSIEYAVNPGRYLLLPGLSIAARKNVMSIILQSRVPLDELDKKIVALTTAAMVFGMLPTALKFGEGSESRAPMAIAVIGGLITSTLLTLVVVPVVYTLIDDFEEWVKKKRAPAHHN